MQTLGAAVRLDRRLMQVEGGTFTRKVTASARMMSTRALLSGAGMTELTTCCRCSIALVGLLTLYKVPRRFKDVGSIASLPVARGEEGRVRVR